MTDTPRHVAAAHFARLQSGTITAAERAALTAWRAADPQNDRAWRETVALWDGLAAVVADPRIAALSGEALSRAPRADRRPWLAAAAAIVAAVTGGALLYRAGPAPPVEVARSPAPTAAIEIAAAGAIERRTLPDGSTVVLAPATRLRLTGPAPARRVELLAGEAMFHVAKGATPFVATARGTDVTALGTRFALRRESDGVRMTLSEGRVRVAPPGGTAVTVAAGSEVTVAGSVAHVRTVDPRDATEWADGRLTFAATPLREAVDRLNRYAGQRIVIGDRAIGALPVTGTFRLDRDGGLAATLAAAGLVRIERSSTREVVLSAAVTTRAAP